MQLYLEKENPSSSNYDLPITSSDVFFSGLPLWHLGPKYVIFRSPFSNWTSSLESREILDTYFSSDFQTKLSD